MPKNRFTSKNEKLSLNRIKYIKRSVVIAPSVGLLLAISTQARTMSITHRLAKPDKDNQNIRFFESLPFAENTSEERSNRELAEQLPFSENTPEEGSNRELAEQLPFENSSEERSNRELLRVLPFADYPQSDDKITEVSNAIPVEVQGSESGTVSDKTSELPSNSSNYTESSQGDRFQYQHYMGSNVTTEVTPLAGPPSSNSAPSNSGLSSSQGDPFQYQHHIGANVTTEVTALASRLSSNSAPSNSG